MGVDILAVGDCQGQHKKSYKVALEDFLDGGIKHRVSKEMTDNSIELARQAIENCLAKSSLQASDIDLIIYLTDIPNFLLGDATKLQKTLGEELQVATYQLKDVGEAGFLIALKHATAFIKSQISKKVLVVCTTNAIAPSSQESFDFLPLATATLLAKNENGRGPIQSSHKMYGKSWESSQILAIEHTLENWPQNFTQKLNGQLVQLRKDRQKIFKEVVETTLNKSSLSKEQISWFITLNAPKNLSKSWQDALGIEKHKHLHSFDSIANGSICSIPYTLMKAIEENKFCQGQKILFFAEGVGLRCSGLTWQW